MKQRRFVVLLGMPVMLLLLRWWVSPAGSAATGVARAVVRPAAGSASQPAFDAHAQSPLAAASAPDTSSVQDDLAAGTRDLDTLEPRNAFSVRLPPPPPTPPTPPAPPSARHFVGPPVPPPVGPPLPPPLQVIGSWHDEQGASVFVAGPNGVRQGRVGDVLLAEYRIVQITEQQVLLKHLPSDRDVPLTVPAGAGPSWTASR